MRTKKTPFCPNWQSFRWNARMRRSAGVLFIGRHVYMNIWEKWMWAAQENRMNVAHHTFSNGRPFHLTSRQSIFRLFVCFGRVYHALTKAPTIHIHTHSRTHTRSGRDFRSNSIAVISVFYCAAQSAIHTSEVDVWALHVWSERQQTNNNYKNKKKWKYVPADVTVDTYKCIRRWCFSPRISSGFSNRNSNRIEIEHIRCHSHTRSRPLSTG